jgi:uncharacterized protein (TIGR02145 family)/prepilin-type N-terminal cleavage/methylation domain-containing protein
MQPLSRTRKASLGFTIVELLIVIVVIAILAAITVVSYNGISSNAKESALKADLKSGATQLGVSHAETGSYPADTTGIKKSDSTTFTYTGGGTTFCLQATSSQLAGKSFYVTEAGSIQSGSCPTAVATMQAFTSAQCAALSVYDGSNASAVISLTDTRGGTTRTYEVAKLADNKCWMLTNLKLGSTTGTTTLTPSDSNIATNFTLPQLTTTDTADYDTPKAYGPVPGDTGAGATNYGYFYNFPAATAGESRTSFPATGGNASYSICPANWRLPTGGATTSDFGQLDIAFGGTGNYADSGQANIARWQYAGPFKGVFAGNWWNGSFYGQGGLGYVWSRSAFPSDANGAFNAYFGSGGVGPGDGIDDRSYGVGVRCLLN